MSSEAATKNQDDSLGGINVLVKGLEASLGKSLAPLEKISDKMGSSKFGKNAKSMGKAMKGMGKASIKAVAIEKIMKTLQPLTKLFELIDLPLRAISALLTVLVSEILAELLPYIIVLSGWILKLIPAFQWLGKVIAWLVINGIQLLIKGVVLLWEKIKQLAAWLKKTFAPAWGQIREKLEVFWKKLQDAGLTVENLKDKWDQLKESLKNVWEWIKKVFTPLWDGLKDSFKILKTAWDESGGLLFGEDGFLAKAFKGILDIGKNIINGILGGFNLAITDINSFLGTNVKTIPLLANGGIITAPTLAMVGEEGPEAVVPLNKTDPLGLGNKEIIALLEEQNLLIRTQNRRLKDIEDFGGFR